VGGILTALSFLAKELSSLDQLSFPASFIRTEWKPLSSSRLRGLMLGTGTQSELRCFSLPAKKLTPSVRSRMSTDHEIDVQTEESNHPGMNTCTKIGGGYPPFSDGRPCLSRCAASTIFLRRKPRESGDPIRIAVPSDQRKRGISPDLPQLNRGWVLAQAECGQLGVNERASERE